MPAYINFWIVSCKVIYILAAVGNLDAKLEAYFIIFFHNISEVGTFL